MPASYLITGANRGIGLELARLLKDQKNVVIATARDPAAAGEINDIADRVEKLDLTDQSTVTALRDTLSHIPIDVLINNAGATGQGGGIDSLNPAEVLDHLNTNTIGPLRVVQAVMPSLRQGSEKKIANISSKLGSIENATPNHYAYGMGKAALNMLTAKLAAELAADGFTVVSLHPGWVKTRMGGPKAQIQPVDSARGLVEVITHMTADNNGGFFDYQGEPLPW